MVDVDRRRSVQVGIRQKPGKVVTGAVLSTRFVPNWTLQCILAVLIG